MQLLQTIWLGLVRQYSTKNIKNEHFYPTRNTALLQQAIRMPDSSVRGVPGFHVEDPGFSSPCASGDGVG